MSTRPITKTSDDARAVTGTQLARILDITRALAVTTELDALLERIAVAATDLLGAERASIWVHDPATHELWTRVALGAGEQIRVRDDRGVVGCTFQENRVIHVPDPYHDPRFNPDVDRHSGYRTRDILAAPMVDVSHRPLGVIQIINSTDGGFSSSDEALVRLLADQAGVAVQRYRLQQQAEDGAALRREMELARRIQLRTLPKQLPQFDGYDLAGWAKPASITAGDCYDFWTCCDGRLGIFLADASGHGMGPTLMVAQARVLVRSFCDLEPDPLRLLARANARLQQDLEVGRFVTAFLGILAPDGRLDWCSAGHAPVLVRDGPGAPVRRLDASHLPLGIAPEMDMPHPEPIVLGPGAQLTVTSDGIFEAPDPRGARFDVDRIVAVLDEHRHATSDAQIAALCQAVHDWQGHDEPHDDQTIVAVRRTS